LSRVLVISFSDLGRDARLERQIGFVRTRHEVVAAGLGRPTGDDVEFVDLLPPERSVPARQGARAALALRLLARRRRAAYWGVQLHRLALERLKGVHADLVIANDVESLPLARRVAGDAPVVFDAHEWAPEQYAHVWWWPLLMRPQVEGLLREHLPQVAAMTTVAPGIAERYERRYGIRCEVVTNAAPETHLSPTGVHDPIRLLHHGGAQPERQLELMIEAVRGLDGIMLDLMLLPTDARYLGRLRELAGGDERLRFLDPVPITDLPSTANEYDAGVIFYPPRHANLELSLPNKFFDFLQARLAVVIGPSPEMARVVREFDCGVVTEGFEVDDLVDTLQTLTPARLAELKRGADHAASAHNAERNREIVLRVVEDALSR
jgi:hypothetical protein